MSTGPSSPLIKFLPQSASSIGSTSQGKRLPSKDVAVDWLDQVTRMRRVTWRTKNYARCSERVSTLAFSETCSNGIAERFENKVKKRPLARQDHDIGRHPGHQFNTLLDRTDILAVNKDLR